MLMQGDFDLNSVQICTQSLEEALKQTMLNQEVLFRKQVEELHRLYTVQKTLTENLAWREFHTYNSRKERTQSTLSSCENQTSFEALTKETIFPSILMVGQTQSTSHVSLEEHLRQRPSDLQLPDQYIRHADPELKLSLGSGEYSWSKGSAERSWFNKEAHSCIHNVIDLEASPSFSYAALKTHSGGENESDVSVLSDPIISSSVKKDLLDGGIADNCSLVDDHKCCQEQNSFNKGSKNCHVGIPSTNLSTKMQQAPSFKAAHVGLNKVQLDDSSCYSNDLVVARPSAASSKLVFIELVGRVQEDVCASLTWRNGNNNCSNETSDMLHQDDAVNSSLGPNNKSNRTEIWAGTSKFDGMGGSEVSLSGVEAVRPPPGLCEDLGCHSSDPNNRNVGLMSELSNNLLYKPNRTCRDTRQMNFEKSEVVDLLHSGSDRSQTTVLEGCGNISPSCKSHSNVDNDSNSAKTMQSATEMRNSNLSDFHHFSVPNIVSGVPETLAGDQEQGSSDSSASKHECSSKNEESSEADLLIQRAAESLVHFSLEISSGNQDCSTKAEISSRNQDCSAKAILTETKNKKKEQPQYSSDSFELISLNLKECSADDYSVSSKSLEVNDIETKDFSLKLRRGRRLKDFQKDILPGLASLSRHEIVEDINILEAVLRSREYRKIRARMADKQGWCAPVRSRRSTRNYVGRKRF
ncbi:hypothetical protein FH972_027020 [Carpinus fangiana]|uniref:Uncharacterized protein n=1 Tax=Carpinus fangiana TaxID=176857 RepID=A0A5N6L6H3_9ROSI|nr:hypothetical protein FH972_027020 [Carpinus fangiana]